jgi:hypothetical protein
LRIFSFEKKSNKNVEEFEKKISVLNLLDSLSESSQDEMNGERVLDLNDLLKILDKFKNNSIYKK